MASPQESVSQNQEALAGLDALAELTPEELSRIITASLALIKSPEDLAHIAAETLALIEPGRQPLPLFTQLGRHAVISTVEVLPVKDSGSGPSVVMTQRPSDDPWWADQWHVPGSVLLPTDSMDGVHDYAAPMNRVFSGELKGSVVPIGEPVLFDTQRRRGPRGHELTAHTWVESQTRGRLPGHIRVFSEADLREADDSMFIEGHNLNARNAIAHYLNHSAH